MEDFGCIEFISCSEGEDEIAISYWESEEFKSVGLTGAFSLAGILDIGQQSTDFIIMPDFLPASMKRQAQKTGIMLYTRQ